MPRSLTAPGRHSFWEILKPKGLASFSLVPVEGPLSRALSQRSLRIALCTARHSWSLLSCPQPCLARCCAGAVGGWIVIAFSVNRDGIGHLTVGQEDGGSSPLAPVWTEIVALGVADAN